MLHSQNRKIFEKLLASAGTEAEQEPFIRRKGRIVRTSVKPEAGKNPRIVALKEILDRPDGLPKEVESMPVQNAEEERRYFETRVAMFRAY